MTTDERTALIQAEDAAQRYAGTTDGVTPNEVADIEAHAIRPPAKAALLAIVLPLAIGIFLAAMDGTIVASSYASIGSELKALNSTSWIATAYMLTQTSFQPLYGKMSDIFGRKPCILFAYAVFAIGCLWCGMARNITELIAARAFAGIGGGGMTTVVSIILSDVVPLRSRGTWQGILNIVFATGSATGAPLGGILADSIGWRWAFLLQVPFTIVAMISVTLFLNLPTLSSKPSSDDESAAPPSFKSKLTRVDFAGALTLVLMVFFLLLGFDTGGNTRWTAPLTLAALSSFALFLGAFAAVELLWATEPFAPKRIVADRTLLASYLANFFGLGAALTVLYHVALYAQAVRGKSASAAGVTLLPAILAGVTGSLAGGLIMQKTGRYYWLTVAGYVLLTAGAIIVVLTTGVVVHSDVGLAIGLSVMSLGNGSGITTTLIALIANAGPEDQAIATAVSYLFRSLGSVVGLSIGSTLLQDTLRSQLRARLTGNDIDEIVRRVRESLTYVDTLEPAIRAVVRSSYEHAVQATFVFTVVAAFCALVSATLIREKALPGR